MLTGDSAVSSIVSTVIFIVELIQTLTIIHSIVSCLAMGSVIGMLGAVLWSALMLSTIAMLTMAYLECTWLLVEYANGNMEAGEQLILNTKINLACTVIFAFGGKVVAPILQKSAVKKLVTTFGDDMADLMLMRFSDPQQLWKCVKQLRKADFTDDVIRTLVFQMDNASFVKLSQMAAKNLPKGLLHALSQNETAVRNITNVADLAVFKNTQKSWDVIVQLLAEKGDDFIRVYRLYQDEVVEVLAVCGSDAITYVDLYQKAFLDMALAHGAVYKTLYDKYGAEYGQELTAKCILYMDELFDMVTRYGDEVVTYVITYGDDVVNGIRTHQKTYVDLLLKHKDIFVRTYKAHKGAAVTLFTTYGDDILTSPELYTDEVLSYVITYGDDVVNGIRAHQKTYVDLLLKHKDIFVRTYKAYKEAAVTLFAMYGDDILTSPELYTDEVLSYVITYGDDVVNGIRTHQKTYVDLLLKHKDIFVRMYKAHGEGAVTAFTTYADDILASPELYTDEVLFYVITYGDDVVNGIRAHQKTYVDLLLTHKDIFVRMYKAHVESAVTTFTTYADDILNFPEQYKDKAVELLIEYSEAVVDGLRNHYDDFLKRYADEGVEFVKEYLEKGDEVFESGRYTVDDDLRYHIENVDPKVPRRRGIGGAHNKDVFLQNDIQIVSITPHPQIPGVEIIEYQMPKHDAQDMPIPGEYQTGKPKIKTVYDPDIFSTDDYLQRGIDAANNAAANYPNGLLPREWVGYDKQGIKWRGYCEDGKIKSFYPE